MCRLE
ncbi:hypothetical protein D030_0237A, partial [Vibrio parahaemolyticus AQ3810]